jgi:hypothetical protein
MQVRQPLLSPFQKYGRYHMKKTHCHIMKVFLVFCLFAGATSFYPSLTHIQSNRISVHLFSAETSDVAIDQKEAVKVFGRLAEKYIMLDDSAGMCCYSACADCEYRLPGGGYRMADQSAARPKWIPSYTERAANDRQHTTKWSEQLFVDGPALTKEEFVTKLKALEYAPPLGGPYVGASAAALDDTSTVAHLFDILVAEGKDKLTKHRMSVRLKELADGEEGLTWAGFHKALGT